MNYAVEMGSGKDQQRALVNKAMNFRVLYILGNDLCM
jgi:hypothetical protein